MNELMSKDYKVIILKGNDLNVLEFDNEYDCDICIMKNHEEHNVTDILKIYKGRLIEYEIHLDIGRMVLWNLRDNGPIPKEATRILIGNKEKE